jgi:mono/diheme cytochrome c family protein
LAIESERQMAEVMIAKRKFSLLILVLPLLLAACSQEVVKNNGLIKEGITAGSRDVIYPDAPPSVPDGQTVWEKQNCASCHGVDGHNGKSKINLADKNYMNRQKPVDQYELLAFGDPKLPADHPILNKTASRKEIWNLVFYVRSLARPAATPAKIMEVDAVFGSNCAVCHGKKGYGDGPLSHNLEPIPANFQDFKRFYDRTDAVLWDHIANGIKWEGMPNFLGKEDKAKNVKFDEAYIWQLVDYVRHFHETTDATLPTSSKPVSIKVKT